VPPGTVNFTRLVSVLFVLDQMGYDGWFGLDSSLIATTLWIS